MDSLQSINIHIQRTPHVTATDFEFLDAMVREPRFHIYAPELDGVDESFINGLRKIAAGDSKVYRDVMSRTEKDTTWAKTFSALFMLKKPIESFDVTQEQHDSNPIFHDFGNPAKNLTPTNAQELVDSMPDHLLRLPNFIYARDTIIAQNVAERLPKIIEENPRLRNLGSVGMLMTIGDNHILVDQMLTDLGFSVTTNDIPVIGAQEKAGLKYLDKVTPTEQEVIEAAAYSIVRGFVSHSSTYELRKNINAFADKLSIEGLQTIIMAIQKFGVVGVEALFEHKIGENDLTFAAPGTTPPPVRMKETYVRKNGRMGIQTSVF